MKKEESIPISKFKAQALGLLDRVARTGRGFTVTRRGKPLVRVIPTTAAGDDKPIPGLLAHTVVHMGDVVSPVCADDWEAAR